MSTPSSRHQSDIGRQLSQLENCFGGGHLLQLREPLSDGGLSTRCELTFCRIAGGVVDAL